ncbi:MAG: hypothetical protein ACYS1A_02820 [Planctomycetota bacterium]
MLIVDKDNILPDSSVLEEVITHHPFHNDLVSQLDTVTIKWSGSVDIETKGPNVTLSIYQSDIVNDRYRYILYHEFGHVADIHNPRFKYSEDVKQALNNRQRENFKELWNLYIDARLNQCNIYRHGSGKFVRKANGPYVVITQKTQLLLRIDYLSKRGFNNASVIVEDIWNNPMKEYTFIDLVNLVKINM